MDSTFIQQVALPIVYVVVGIALIWALVELIIFLRSTRKTVSDLEGEIRPVISDVKEMTESLKPAIDKMDPLAERVSLAVDAANLEIMRLDGILENVDSLTGSASNAANAVEAVANTPLKLVNSAADKLRGAFSQKKASDASVALGAAGEEDRSAGALGESASASTEAAQDASAVRGASGSEGRPSDGRGDASAPSGEAGPSQPSGSGYFTYEG